VRLERKFALVHVAPDLLTLYLGALDLRMVLRRIHLVQALATGKLSGVCYPLAILFVYCPILALVDVRLAIGTTANVAIEDEPIGAVGGHELDGAWLLHTTLCRCCGRRSFSCKPRLGEWIERAVAIRVRVRLVVGACVARVSFETAVARARTTVASIIELIFPFIPISNPMQAAIGGNTTLAAMRVSRSSLCALIATAALVMLEASAFASASNHGGIAITLASAEHGARRNCVGTSLECLDLL
jgi:hypothetical protein